MLIVAALMQDQLGRSSLTIRHKRNLCIDDLGEEIMIAFWEYLDLSLPGCLGNETIALPRDLQDEVRRQLTAAHVAVEYFRIQLHHLALRCEHHGSPTAMVCRSATISSGAAPFKLASTTTVSFSAG